MEYEIPTQRIHNSNAVTAAAHHTPATQQQQHSSFLIRYIKHIIIIKVLNYILCIAQFFASSQLFYFIFVFIFIVYSGFVVVAFLPEFSYAACCVCVNIVHTE